MNKLLLNLIDYVCDRGAEITTINLHENHNRCWFTFETTEGAFEITIDKREKTNE